MGQKTILQSFYEKEQIMPNKSFLRQPFGDRWETYTWQQAAQMARKLATGLQSLGLPAKSHIGLVSKNCREWIIADLAIMIAGYVSVPFYPTLTGEQIKEVIHLGDVKALFVGKTEVWEDMKKGVPADLPIIAFPHYEGNSKVTEGEQWDTFLDRFEPLQGNPLPDMEDLWTIVFTSGTTGTPKGVMLNHQALASLDAMVHQQNYVKVSFDGDNRFFSFLPLNHIAERALIEFLCIAHGGEISFVETIDTFAKNLRETQPTMFFAVPRIWTKFQLGVLGKMSQKKLNLFLKIPILSGLVKNKIKKGLGLSNARACVSGAAPIAQSLKDWYKRLGISISEGYGMTENCAVCSFLSGDEDQPGSVGKPAAGVDLKIDEDTGEVCMKADFVMQGYYNAPEKTAEVLRDGWLHTGDQGWVNEDGYLYLTGRVKDTFKTSKGIYIVPAPMEWVFDANTDIEQICIVGLGMPQPMGIVTLSELGEMKSKEEVKESLIASLEKANEGSKNDKKISTLIIAKEAFSVENGLLTPTLKVKRNILNKHYNEQLLAWHQQPDQVIWEG
ncbi:AMP-binding protein [Microscilla marina]|uniref:AMP-dependent synthetase and ligase n=1 Tax=Microscilla marina ATCC 23134 TaxID=313606 RepID=A1ZDI8_MICM2|nr:AMP-binding protein [Microscilla marina]EAY31727.1 AMP-dependent synthetase and ligase [Microscilla marina ATCC 23134]